MPMHLKSQVLENVIASTKFLFVTQHLWCCEQPCVGERFVNKNWIALLSWESVVRWFILVFSSFCRIKHSLSGSLIDRRVVLCPSQTERSRWVETLREEAKLVHNHVSSKPQSLNMLVSGCNLCLNRRYRSHGIWYCKCWILSRVHNLHKTLPSDCVPCACCGIFRMYIKGTAN